MSQPRGRSGDLTRRLTQPIVLEDGRPPRVLTTTLYAVSGFVIAAVAWGAITQVREVAFAPGQVIPRGHVQPVQHLEGGIVAEILVHEGQQVKAGQALVRLQPEGPSSDRNQLESRRANFRLQLIRLDALSQDKAPDFGALGRDYPALAVEQEKLFASASSQRRQQRATHRARIGQKLSDVNVVTRDLESARAQVVIQRELVAMQDTLIAKGLSSRRNRLEAQSVMQRAAGEAGNLEGRLTTARQALAEAEASFDEASAASEQKLSEERAKAAAELAETEQQLVKLADRYDRLLVRAPSDGVVQELLPKSVNEVVRAGDAVARIVPSGMELVAEVRVDPKDSGEIHIGDSAQIRLTAFDSAKFGTVPGSVEYVSATTVAPTPSLVAGQAAPEPYYKVIIRLDRDHVGTGATHRAIAPGMVVQAQIITGSKSIVRYMLKPVFDSLDIAFSER